MLGSCLLVTPALVPQAETVMPSRDRLAQGTIWYDWYTLAAVQAEPGVNTSVEAPLGHIPLFLRGGSILPLQQPGNTTATSRQNPCNLLIALDGEGSAAGDLYLDDGESLVQEATKYIKVSLDVDWLLIF